jgi:uncharacterized YigZ family protein
LLFSDSYFTIIAPGQSVFRDRGSKFLGFAFPVNSLQEVKDCLSELRKERPSASHHCYAWRLGGDKSAFRAHDDGEPSGTAGKPILNKLLSRDLTNTLLVVVRYFGGTLLGAGGLVNAYKQAASEALDGCVTGEKFISFEYSVSFQMSEVSAVMRILKEFESKIISNAYESENKLVFQTKKRDSEKLEARFSGLHKVQLKFIKML